MKAPAVGSTKPISKKEACAILKIAYNTTRLEKIIEEYHDTKQYRKRRRESLRGTLATRDEIADTIQSQLRGDPITDTSKRLYRSVPFLRNIINKVGIPSRGSNELERSTTAELPEQCLADEFRVGDIVWSAKYHCAAKVKAEYSKEYCNSKKGLQYVDYENKYGSKCYSIFVNQPSEDFNEAGSGFYANSLAYDLGTLTHLIEYGVDLENIS